MMSLPVAETGFAEATWILVVKSIVIFIAIFLIVPVLTVVERKLIGRFQARYGPNRVGPVGLLQPLADVGKLISKEFYRPRTSVGTAGASSPGRLKNSAKPPSASRSRRTITLSYVSSAFATRSTSGRGNPSAYPTSRTADRARYVTRLQTIPVCSSP